MLILNVAILNEKKVVLKKVELSDNNVKKVMDPN